MTRRHRGQRDRREDHTTHGGSIWLWGVHAVRAALKNPRRRGRKLLLADAAGDFRELAHKAKVPLEAVDPGAVSRALPREAVHQGVALLADPLEEVDVHDVMEASAAPRRLILLD